ncbi:formate dehydrogenase accessory sulfurtransferase FdhD [Roseospira goensis]|uniref:Sulfur carrier protein FdhD n=1 Tax=Roseospira goensis TaxID=391922 RepID=A0A7W6RXL3_9PROT|nr:formate dehydrogenase accessory sulfurtransferase FdhD [Roseospira goensis]MBB4285094.1 FdhD protein [Roseospira goensis]
MGHLTSPPDPATVAGALHRPDGGAGRVDWTLPEEAPIGFVYNGDPFAVMMATPADLEDFALGFSLAEGIIPAPDALLLAKVRRRSDGWELCLAVDPDAADADRLAERRGLEGRSGCGLCGVATLAEASRALPRVGPPPEGVTPATIARAFAALPDHQPLNARTRSVHAAAFCDPTGRIMMAREDVGRHSALDKLIGALARAGLDPRGGFCIMTSRCSVELVQKAARVGVPLLATVSAPTTLALETARRVGLRLAALARPDGVVTFG